MRNFNFKIVTDISVIVLSIIGVVFNFVNCFLWGEKDALMIALLFILILMDNIELLIVHMEDEWWKKIL